MTNYTDFIGLYPVQKTLRFELRPQGKTAEKMRESGLLEQDREKAKNYIVMKALIDDYHRRFINELLEKASFDWQPLFEALNNVKVNKDDKSKKELEKEQLHMRKELIGLFEKDERFKYLFSEKLFSELLNKEISERNDPDEMEAMRSFDRFSGYFIGFHENRRNIYSNEDKHNSLAYRVVAENFPKFADNCRKYSLIKENMQEAVVEFKKEIASVVDIDVDQMFDISYFNKVLTQKGIDDYNTMLGGVSEEGSVKIRGLNEFLNLYYQKVTDNKRIKMAPLYKQILCESKTKSFIPYMFENDEEVISSINQYYDSVKYDILQRSVYLLSNYKEYDASKIFIDQKSISSISIVLFGSWETLGGLMQIYKADQIGDPGLEKTRKKVDKWLSSSYFTLKEVFEAIGEQDPFRVYVEKLSLVLKNIEEFDKSCLLEGTHFSGDELLTQDIKGFLDLLMEVQHLMKPFNAKEDLDKDAAFYSEYNEIYEALSEIIPLYNKVRNYATKKKYSTYKIKMNFGNPTLAAGWDLNKERDNTAVILLRGNNYYLGIMNPKKKTKFEELPSGEDNDCYRKMVYKLLPGPNKMLPKVFFSKKGIGTFNPSKEILEGYEAGKHKLGDSFDIDYCHLLIDFFKENIPKYGDWGTYEFKFSPTEEYSDISQFYKEVSEQGYKIRFQNISRKAIDDLVNNGALFLYQIYNKDFSEHSKGKNNLHTMYWKAAFSEENLRNVVIKINGEAELFYRDKSDISKTEHSAGTILVNRTNRKGNPIPNSIYYELFKYKTGQIKSVSDEAKQYLDDLETHEAKYPITKDRRYTEDRMFFHIPITLNFGSSGNTNINKAVIDHVLNSKDVHIIGIDRGERNLVYVSVIDRKGNIIKQRSFNVVDGIDYHEKLDQREKENISTRKSWSNVEKIKDLKEGYLSYVIHELSKMIIEYNAIVVLEDLNFGFKRGRFKVEKQVYQKFEKMLIEKLNYLAFKDRIVGGAGGILKAYQLTDVFDSFQKLGKQTGVLFYVPAAYTSKIDPTTGFVDIFNTTNITNAGHRSEFIKKMRCIRYNATDMAFEFTFDYRDFSTSQTDHRNIWTISTGGNRIKYNRKTRENYTCNPTADIESALKERNIKYLDGSDLSVMIRSCDDVDLTNVMYYAFHDSLKMRNSDKNVDYIQSPVKNKFGKYFITGVDKNLPIDADANGAYHIALKGEYMLRSIEYNPNAKYVKMPLITNADWLKFVQTRAEE